MIQGSAEWHAERAKRLTASDFAAALGIHPYCSRQKLWRIKVGVETMVENGHMRRGMKHERDALFRYAVETGLWVDEVGLVLHPAHDWLAASPDGTVGDAGLVEAKCPTRFRDEPPAYHMAQIQGQMECAGRDWCDYVQFVDGDIRVTRVLRDRTWWEWAFPRLEEFWGYVRRLEPPPRMRK